MAARGTARIEDADSADAGRDRGETDRDNEDSDRDGAGGVMDESRKEDNDDDEASNIDNRFSNSSMYRIVPCNMQAIGSVIGRIRKVKKEASIPEESRACAIHLVEYHHLLQPFCLASFLSLSLSPPSSLLPLDNEERFASAIQDSH